MRKIRMAFAALIGVAGVFVGVQAAVAGPNGSDEGTMCVYTTQLRAENEVPFSNSESLGVSQIKVRNDGTIEFMTHINNKGGETFVAGHIHRAPEGTPGPVVQSLFQGGPTSDSQIMQSGEVSNPVLGAAICSDPTAYYVNYHTTAHPSGAIRGQLG
jgi:CHRD domain-containing protein